jgi:hypothetical protein
MAFNGSLLTQSFKTQLFQAGHNFSTQTFKCALFVSGATLGGSTATYSAGNAYEVSGTYYTAGGLSLTVSGPTYSAGTAYIDFAPVTFSGTMSPRGALIYNSTSGNASVAVLDFGADQPVTSSLTVQFPSFDPINSLIRL